MDIKAKAMELVTKIASDPKLLESFTKNPVPTVEKLIGIDLPDDQINMVVDMVKIWTRPVLCWADCSESKGHF